VHDPGPHDRPIDPDAYGRAFADVYDAWYADLSDPAAVANHVASAAPAGPLLELGVGTGRLSTGFRDHGRTLIGIDTSSSMLNHWTAGDPGAIAARANMASLPFAAQSLAGVFVAYNTFFNVITAEAQQQCMHECSRVLQPGGVLVLEAFVPPPTLDRPEYAISRSRTSADAAVLIATCEEPSGQTMTGAHLDFGPHGLRVRPWRIRWCDLEELDQMAGSAGLTLISRFADWTGSEFGLGAERHVSTWQLRI